MRALSIHNLWCWATVAGHKPVENRTWKTDYRGTILLHASANRASLERSRAVLTSCGIECPADDELEFGAIIGAAELVRCEKAPPAGGLFAEQPEPLAFGPWCWCLENIRPLRAITCRGMVGLFEPPADVIADVRSQLAQHVADARDFYSRH